MDDVVLKYEEMLEKIDSIIAKSFTILNPTNEAEEKKKFFLDKSYEPKFTYKEVNLNLDKELDEIQKITLPESNLNRYRKEKLEKLKINLELINSIGKEEFSYNSIKSFGFPKEDLIRNAKKILTIKQANNKNGKTINTIEAISLAQSVLKKAGLIWTVEEKEMVPIASVLATDKTLFIKKDATMPQNFLKRIIYHEIGTHVFRSENGALQPSRLFKIGFADYISTEEGLAANIEEKNNCLDSDTLRTYAGRTIAVEFAKNHTFRQTFDMLKKHFDEEKAWEITLRVKRGVGTTHGVYSRDHIYLKGYINVKKYLRRDKNALTKLYCGKIDLKTAKELHKINIKLVEPKYLPEKLKNI